MEETTNIKRSAKSLVFLIRLLIGTILLTAVLLSISFEELIKTICSTSIISIFSLFLVIIVNIFVISLSIYTLSEKIKEIRFTVFLKEYLIAHCIGVFSPLQSGQASIIYFLSKHGIPAAESAKIFIVHKTLSFVILLLLGLGSLTILFDLSIPFMICTAILLIILISIFFILIKGITIKIFQKISFSFINLFTHITLTFFRLFFIYPLPALVLLLSLDLQIPKYKIFLLEPAINLTSLVPFSIQGLGVKEAGGAYLYPYFGQSSETIIAAYIIIRVISSLFSGIVLLISSFSGIYQITARN